MRLNIYWPFKARASHRPMGLRWRSSVWFVTLVVGLGMFTDVFFYTIIIPVVPFRLQTLRYRNPSSLTGWLLFSFSVSLVLSTPLIAWLSEKYQSRRMPLLIGLLGLMGAQIIFMLAPTYWLMVLARALQGLSSTIVWTIGLALLSDTSPESKIGQQMGLSMSGISIGSILAPPIGGALYERLGFHAPFIFSLGVVTVDIVGRLLVIERKEALKWGFDPKADPNTSGKESDGPKDNSPQADGVEVATTPTLHSPTEDPKSKGTKDSDPETVTLPACNGTVTPPLSSIQVILIMFRSSRALAATINAFLFGVCYIGQEPTFPLRLQHAYRQSPLQVGILYLPIVLPTMLSGFVSGKLADQIGSGTICTICFLMCTPWSILLIIHSPLPLFIIFAVLTFFFLSAATTPITAELAAVARTTPGVKYTHVYGGFNMAFGLGSAGPLIAGIMYDHLRQGWTAVILLTVGMALVAAGICFFFMDEVPLAVRICRRPETRQWQAGTVSTAA